MPPLHLNDKVHGLAGSLAKPVLARHMTPRQAYAAIALNAMNLPDAEQVTKDAWQTLKSHVQWRRERRDSVVLTIRTLLWRLIQERRPRNMLLAEAHGVNGAHGFLFTENEVTQIVIEEVYFSLPKRGRRE